MSPRLSPERGVESVQTAIARAEEAIRRDAGSAEAFEAATALAELLGQGAEDAALLRAQIAREIKERDELSLAQLAERLGVSKPRADQLIRRATGRPHRPAAIAAERAERG